MPTGYTAGILDGKIKDFPSFAKLCARAFGATIHMRDDDMNTEYQPRVPSKYYSEKLAELNKDLTEINGISDSDLKEKLVSELLKDKQYHTNGIAEDKNNLDILNDFLKEADAYQPPTAEHEGIKKFMIQQITETISWDANSKYHKESLADIEINLSTFDIKQARKTKVASIEKDIAYHTTQLNEEIERCETSNKWVEDYYNSISVVAQ